jgi:hypothetical protein
VVGALDEKVPRTIRVEEQTGHSGISRSAPMDVQDFYEVAAVMAMGNVWMRYVRYIPADQQEEFKQYLVSNIRSSLSSTAAIFGLTIEHQIRNQAIGDNIGKN